MPRSDDPAELIELIYEAAVDASIWPTFTVPPASNCCIRTSRHLK